MALEEWWWFQCAEGVVVAGARLLVAVSLAVWRLLWLQLAVAVAVAGAVAMTVSTLWWALRLVPPVGVDTWGVLVVVAST